MVKRCPNIFIYVKKKTCLGVLDRGEQGDGNEIGLKEGGGIEMSTTVLHSRAAPSLELLTFLNLYFLTSLSRRLHLFLIPFLQIVV